MIPTEGSRFHKLCFPPRAGSIFAQIDNKRKGKRGKARPNACGITNNAKQCSPRRTINRKCLFSPWILQNSRCADWPQSGPNPLAQRAGQGCVCCFCVSSTFKIMLPTEDAEHFFKKMDKIIKERVCRALKAQKKTADGMRISQDSECDAHEPFC